MPQKKGATPWNKGLKETRKDVLEKMRISHLNYKWSPETILKRNKVNTGKKRSAEFIEKMSGNNNKRWIEDRTQLSRISKQGERRTSAYFYWRKQIWLRDNFKCKIANPDCSGRLEAHHILGWTAYPELR